LRRIWSAGILIWML